MVSLLFPDEHNFGSTWNNPASGRARRFINSIPKQPRRLGRVEHEKVFTFRLTISIMGRSNEPFLPSSSGEF